MQRINKPSALDCGLERRAVKMSTFAKLYTRTTCFISIFCSCVIYRCLKPCTNNPHVSFQAVCSILVLQHFKWSSTHTMGGGAPRRAVLGDSHYGKGVQRNSALHFLVEHNSFFMKRWNSWKVGNLEIVSHIFPPTQANNK